MSASPALRPRERDARPLRNQLHAIALQVAALAPAVREFEHLARETRAAAVRDGRARSAEVAQAEEDELLSRAFALFHRALKEGGLLR